MLELEVGSVVTLKSGGPSMTVSEFEQGKQEVKCVWFDCAGCIHEYQFHPNALLLDDRFRTDDTLYEDSGFDEDGPGRSDVVSAL